MKKLSIFLYPVPHWRQALLTLIYISCCYGFLSGAFTPSVCCTPTPTLALEGKMDSEYSWSWLFRFCICKFAWFLRCIHNPKSILVVLLCSFAKLWKLWVGWGVCGQLEQRDFLLCICWWFQGLQWLPSIVPKCRVVFLCAEAVMCLMEKLCIS